MFSKYNVHTQSSKTEHVIVVIFGTMINVYRKGHELQTLRDQRKTCLFSPQILVCSCTLTLFSS